MVLFSAVQATALEIFQKHIGVDRNIRPTRLPTIPHQTTHSFSHTHLCLRSSD